MIKKKKYFTEEERIKAYRVRKSRQQKKYAQSEKGKATTRKWYLNLSPEQQARIKEKNRKYRKTTNHKRYKFASYLRSIYNMTIEEYAWLIYNQNFRCAICNNPFNFEKQNAIHVDHNHRTGEIRGILCLICNTILIGAIESPNFHKACEYLKLDL